MFWAIEGRDIALLGAEGALAVDVGGLDAALARPTVAVDLARIGARSTADLLT